MPNCCQCSRPACLEIVRNPLCIDCYHKYETANAMARQAHSAALRNSLDAMAWEGEMIAFQLGFSQKLPVRRTPMIENQFTSISGNGNLVNSGIINADSITVSTVNNNVGFNNAIEKLKQASFRATTINDQQKKELIDSIDYIEEEAAKPVDKRKMSFVRNALTNIKNTVQLCAELKEVWDFASPLLHHTFQMTLT